MNMDQVDSGIKMLVEAIAEAQSSATNGSPQCTGITSTPLRQSVPTAHSLETSITMSPAPVLGNVSAGEARENGNEESGGDSSINSGYNGDTSALPGDFNSPAKSNCQPGTPLTPTANLKMLVAAASSALDLENANAATSGVQSSIHDNQSDKEDESSSRKLKSLALLCKRFLQVADKEIGPGKEFSLEMIANSLGINRRRIYDIINVMEALEMISKQSKNWYLWHGQSNLVATLAKLKAMAVDDPDIQPYLDISHDSEKTNNKENENNNEDSSATPKGNLRVVMEEEDEDDDSDVPAAARSVRYDKSLGVLCQKFVMLFLISACTEITLEDAGKILVPDYHDDTLYMALNPPVNPKTKVRRLYDIANILSSLGLIKKKVFVGPHHIKKPGYAWSGPSLADIEAISVSRKNEYVLNKGLMRRSISSRPYLHQYEVQTIGRTSGGSAPNSPAKSLTASKFKRSLSFGAMRGGVGKTVGTVVGGVSGDAGTGGEGASTSSGANAATTCNSCSSSGSDSSSKQQPQQSTVVARPLCPKQVDYLREMKEFETEMQKHSHRYPHVATIFHEFLQKYQATMEQSASANGRYILPKSADGGGGANGLSPPSSPSHQESDQKENEGEGGETIGISDVKPEVSQVDENVTFPPIEATPINIPINSKVLSADNGSSVQAPPTMPACRYETRAREETHQLTHTPSSSSSPSLTQESFAMREKQKMLEMLSQKPNLGGGMVSLPSNSPGNGGVPLSAISTSTLVTNLANSILVNVLHNNMMEAAAAGGGATLRGSFPPCQSKQGFHVEDLQPQTAGGGGGGGMKEPSFIQQLQQQSPVRSTLRGLSQNVSRNPGGMVQSVEAPPTSVPTSSAMSFNPNQLLNSQGTASYVTPKFSVGNVGPVFRQAANAYRLPPCNEAQGGPCPKHRKLN